jgi:hypothetical protein
MSINFSINLSVLSGKVFRFLSVLSVCSVVSYSCHYVI